MTYNWTDGPELSILLVNANGRDYVVEVQPDCDSWEQYGWCLSRDGKDMDWNVSADRDTVKSDAEHFLSALIEKDFNEGDNS